MSNEADYPMMMRPSNQIQPQPSYWLINLREIAYLFLRINVGLLIVIGSLGALISPDPSGYEGASAVSASFQYLGALILSGAGILLLGIIVVLYKLMTSPHRLPMVIGVVLQLALGLYVTVQWFALTHAFPFWLLLGIVGLVGPILVIPLTVISQALLNHQPSK